MQNSAYSRLVILVFLLFFVFFQGNGQSAADLTGIGIPNRIEVTHDFDLVSGFTLEYWVYFNSLKDFNALVTKTTSEAAHPIDMYANSSGDLLVAFGDENPDATAVQSITNPVFSAGQWYHVAVTYDPSSTGTEINIYINGDLQAVYTVAAINMANSSNPIIIGNRESNASYDADALFDDVRVWSGARTGAEIAYDRYSCLAGSETGLEVWLDMEGDLLDGATSNGSQNGTLIGSASYASGIGCERTVTFSNPVTVSSAVFINQFDVLSQDANPQDLLFNDDGTQMYVIGTQTHRVYAYDLSIAYDVTSASYSGTSLDLSGETSDFRGMTFDRSGTRLYAVSANTDRVYEYLLPVAYDLTGGYYTGTSLLISADGSPEEIVFSHSGDLLFVLGSSTGNVYSYSLSTPFDIASGTLLTNTGVATTGTGLAFNADGTKMFVVSRSSDEIHTYDLGTAYDLTTSNDSDLVKDILAEENNSLGLFIDATGTRLYVIGDSNSAQGRVTQYDLGTLAFVESDANDGSVEGSMILSLEEETFTTPLNSGSEYTITNLPSGLVPSLVVSGDGLHATLSFSGQSSSDIDVSDLQFSFVDGAFTGGLASSVSGSTGGSGLSIDFGASPGAGLSYASPITISSAILVNQQDVLSQETAPQDVMFNRDGSRMYVVGAQNNRVYSYDLSINYDVTTAVYSGTNLDLSDETTSFRGMTFNQTGTRLYAVSSNTDRVYEYFLPVAYDLTGGYYTGTSLLISVDGSPEEIVFSHSGDLLFVLGSSTGNVYSYSLSTPFDIASGTLLTNTGVATTGTGLAFNADGTKMFVVSRSSDEIHTYDLGTAYDLTTSNDSDLVKDILAEENNSLGLFIDATGTRLYVIGDSNSAQGRVTQYDLGTLAFVESDANDGSVEGSMILSLEEETFTTPLNSGSEYTITNLPSGLVPSLVVSGDGLHATLSFSGQSSSDIDVSDLQFSFVDGAFTGGLASSVSGSTGGSGLSIDFGASPGAGLSYASPITISSAILVNQQDVLSQETAPQDVMFNRDGSRMYVVGAQNNRVYSYDLSINYDVTTAVYSGTNLDLSDETTSFRGMTFNQTGTRLYAVSSNTDRVYEYFLPVAYDLTGGYYTGTSLLISVDGSPEEIVFSHSGDLLFVLGSSTGNVYSYSLSSPFDIASGTLLTNTGVATTGTGLAFNADGTKMFVVSRSSDEIHTYDLGTAYDLTTSNDSDLVKDILAEENNSLGLFIDATGTRLYVIGDSNSAQGRVTQYDLGTLAFVESDANDGSVEGSMILSLEEETFTTPLNSGSEYTITNLPSGLVPSLVVSGDGLHATLSFSGQSSSDIDVSDLQFSFVDGAFTGGLASSVSGSTGGSGLSIDFGASPGAGLSYASPITISSAILVNQQDVLSQETAPQDVMFNRDGSRMYVVGAQNNRVYSYDLSINYDVTTAVYSGTNLDLSDETTSFRGMTFNQTGTRLYAVSSNTDRVYEYFLPVAYDLTGGYYTGTSLLISVDGSPEEIVFSHSGDLLFVLGSSTGNVYSYSLSSPFDIASGTLLTNTGVATTGTGLAFNADGTKMFVVSRSSDEIHTYDLGTAYDLTTSNDSDLVKDILAEENNSLGLFIDATGTRLYVIGDSNSAQGRVTQYDLGTLAFVESDANDGSVEGSMILSLEEETFTTPLNSGSEYTITNLPSGLVPSLVVSGDGLHATLSFSGQSTSDIDVSDLQFSFVDGAFTGGLASSVSGSTGGSGLSIDFGASPGAGLSYASPITISSAILVNQQDVLSQETAPQDVMFNRDGSRMYVVGAQNNRVYSYDLSINYDVTTAVYSGTNLDLSDETTSFTGMTFNRTGTRLYAVSSNTDRVYEYFLPVAYDLAGGYYTGTSIPVSEDSSPQEIIFDNSGHLLFMLGGSTTAVYTYSLTTPFDLTSASFQTNTSVSQASTPTGFAFNADGTKLFVSSRGDDEIHAYNVVVGFDLTSSTYAGASETKDILAEENNTLGLFIDPSGTRAYIIGDSNSSQGRVTQYDLGSNPFIESAANDGTIEGSMIVVLEEDEFTNASGNLIAGTDFSMPNLPAGLTPTLSVSADGYSAVLTISGSTDPSNNADEVADLTFTFTDGAFVNSNVVSVNNAVSASSDLGIDFLDDVTPPVLSGLALNIGDALVSVDITSDELVDFYYVITTSSTSPTAQQVVDGQDHLGAPAINSGSFPSLSGTQSFFNLGSPPGLTPSTDYVIYWVAEDVLANRSAVLSGSFTTLDRPDVTVTSIALADGDVSIGSASNLFYQFSISSTGGDATYQGSILNLEGGYNSSDFENKGFELRTNSIDDFASATTLSSSSLADSDLDLNADEIGWIVNQLVTDGSTQYFYLSVDISSSAVVGNDFNLQIPSIANFLISSPSDKLDGGISAGSAFSIVLGDATPPTVTLSTTTATNVSPFSLTVSFSEEVSGFDGTSLSVSNGTVGTTSTSDNIAYEVEITPDTEGSVFVDAGAGIAQDLAGNDNTASGTFEFVYDITSPVVTVDVLTTNATSPELSGTVDDAIASLSLTVNSEVHSPVNNGDGTWTLAASTISALTEGTYEVSITATDAAGNVGTDGTSDELTVDTSAPVVTVTSLTTNESSPELSGTVDDAIATLSVTVNSEVHVPINNGDGTWTLTASTISALAEGTYEVSITATDAAGNAGSDASMDELTIDQTVPGATLVSDAGDYTNVSPASLTLTFSEEVTGLTDTDFTVSNGTIDNLSSGDNITYTFEVVITAEGSVEVSLPGGSVSDAAGNGNDASNTVTLTYDSGLPTVMVSSVDPAYITGGDWTVEIAFSEEVTGLTSDDLSVDNGTISSLSSDDNINYTVLITPINQGEISLSVPAGVVDDLSGNSNEESNTVTRIYDTVAPTVTLADLSTADDSPELSGTVNDASASISVMVDGTSYLGTNNGDGSWTLANNTLVSLAVDTYTMEAQATDVGGNVGPSVSASLTIEPGPAEALAASGIGFFEFTANWQLREGVSSYELDVSDQSDFSSFLTGFESFGTTVSSQQVTGLDYSKTYYYRVRAVYPSSVVSANSETIAVTTNTDPGTEADSLALLAIYEALGGDNWTSSVNWQSGLPLSSWDMISQPETRVTTIDLSGNNLTGAFPTLSEGLEAVTSLNLSNNEITSLPALTTLTSVTSLDVSNNRLEFGSLEANILITGFVEAPQKPVGLEEELLLQIGNTYELDRTISGGANAYSWFRTDLEGNNEENLNNSSPTLSRMITGFDEDEGHYFARVTNTNVPGLTLSTRPIIVKVSSLERDMAALTNIYEAMDGPNWSLQGQPVDWSGSDINTWNGISVQNQRVVGLNLSGAGLTGDLPADITDVAGLTSINLSNNSITGLPDLTNLENLGSTNVSENLLDFGDLEPNVSLSSFQFSNQGLLPGVEGDTVPRGSNYLINFSTAGTANNYIWILNNDVVSNETITGANEMTYQINDIAYDNMGSYTVRVTNDLIPELTLTSEPQPIYASANLSGVITDLNGTRLSSGEMDAFKILGQDQPYDTANTINVNNGEFLFPGLVLGDYLCLTGADLTVYLPTYFGNTDLWTEADTVFLREDLVIEGYQIQNIPEPPTEGEGRIFGFVEAEFEEEESGGRYFLERRKVKKAGCSVRRFKAAGREQDGTFELIAYVETNDEGEFEFDFLPAGLYRFNIEYPGIPMDENTFVEFELGGDGFNANNFKLAAFITEEGIAVERVEALAIYDQYFRNLAVYPIPANDRIHIQYSRLLAEDVEVRLVDLQGQIILQQSIAKGFKQSYELDITHLAEGNYLIYFQDPDMGSIVVYKVVIRH